MKQQLKEFTYRAISKDGKRIYGTVTDYSVNEAINKLLAIGLNRINFI